ncbi:diguanylate cyclase domain-containing protein [Photobacterium piscicola]
MNHHDPLTDLPNRIALTNRLNNELKKSTYYPSYIHCPFY